MATSKRSKRRRLFLDTSGLYELLVENSRRHAEATETFRGFATRPNACLVTDFVLQEAATLFKARSAFHLVPNLFALVEESRAIEVIGIDRDLFRETFRFFVKHDDKTWSYVDCSSFVVMKQTAISKALTTDHHFQQAGFEALLAE
jgi:predicted nucleic acid-binding protein